MSVHSVSPAELLSALQSGGCTLVDVRTPVEFRDVHVEGAINIPLDRLGPTSVPQPGNDRPLYIICHKGSRGANACQKLSVAGLTNLVNVEGGTLACQQAGLPVVKGRKAISLERQVRIAAGSLVLIGVALGALAHPYLYGLSALVGAGLVFAGITDTCGMGILLARMPWNRTGPERT